MTMNFALDGFGPELDNIFSLRGMNDFDKHRGI